MNTAVYMPGVAGPVAILKPPPTPAQKKKRAAEAKGKRLEQTIKAWLESRGWKVETAPKVLRRYFDTKAQQWARKVQRHDFFGVWDGIAVKGSQRSLYQVTTLTNIAHKRSKIAESGFPVTGSERIYGYVGRPGKWRVLTGPAFAMPGEEITCARSKPPAVLSVASRGTAAAVESGAR